MVAWSRSKKNYKKIQKLGAKTCQNLIDLPAKCQVIIMMLVDDEACMQISNKIKNQLKTYNRRSLLLLLGKFGLFSIVGLKLFNIQIINSNNNKKNEQNLQF